MTRSERDKFVNEIQRLEPTVFDCNGVMIRINHELALTMVDGKAVNALTNTASSVT